jgi:hypothetical protein
MVKITVTKFTVDMLYYSPLPEVVNEYLQSKVSRGGFWENWGNGLCETKIVSASSMTEKEYKDSWLYLTGDCYKMEDRYRAMTTCPLLTTMFGMCEI